jgi:hypothetical protein
MASIRITPKMQIDIKDAAVELIQKRLDSELSMSAIEDALEPLILNRIVNPILGYRDNLPDSHKGPFKSLLIKEGTIYANGKQLTLPNYWYYPASELVLPRYVTCNIPTYFVTNWDLSSDGNIPDLIVDPVWDWLQERNIAEEERLAVRKTLDAIFDKVSTVIQFLRLWPQGESLLPKNVLDKMYQPKAVAEPKPELVSQDELDSLNIALLRSKILNN